MKYEQSNPELGQLLREYASSTIDLLVILGYVAVADAVLVGSGLGSTVRAVVGFPLLVFFPGYVVLAALFPRRYSRNAGGGVRAFDGITDGALRTFERWILSFGVSLSLLPPLGLAIAVAGLGFEPATLLGAVNAVVLLGLGIAVFRRLQVPEVDRDGGLPAFRQWGTSPGRPTGSRVQTVATVALIVVAVLSTAVLGFALATPNDGESYTTVSLLSENESGQYVTAGYETDLTRGESESLTVAVANHEGQRTDYQLVGELQRVQRVNGTTEVVAERELTRANRTVAPGETWMSNQTVTPTMTGTNLRLVFFVYEGEAPTDPRVETASQSVHLWANVSA